MSKKNKVGRTTDYFSKVKPYSENIKYWVSMGITNKEIAKKLTISEDSFYEYQRVYQEFKQAVVSTRSLSNKKIAEALETRAIGYNVEDTKEIEEEYWAIDKITKLPYRVLDDLGNPILMKRKEVIKKHIPADSRAATFVLANRDKENWQLNGNSIQINNQNNNMNLQQNNFLSELSDEDLLNEIKKLEG